jgi:hypothetical protein
VYLLDVNALVALAWDSHVHHIAMRCWFRANAAHGWATSPVTESGFVRVSTNPTVLPVALGFSAAVEVLARLRAAQGHVFLRDDVSVTAPDFPTPAGYRQTTDAHLLTLARRNQATLLTFDSGVHSLAVGADVLLLRALD